MTFKKVLSAVMAGAMVLSMGLTAFATGTPTGTPTGQVKLEGEEGYEIEVGGATQVATIKVQVPEVVGFIVNPYRLDAKNEEIGITTAGDTQVVSPLQKIVNLSDFKISVGGTIYAYENSEEAKLVATLSSATAPAKPPKEAVINFVAKAGTKADTTALKATGTGVASVDLSTAKTDAGVALVAIQVDEKDGTSDAYTFNFDGSAQDAPATAWTEGDTFGATISFTFTAVANAANP